MAPRQLRLEPIEVDSTADKVAKRVRVDSCKKEHLGVPQSIPCTLPKEGEYCRNGKHCLYLHPGGAGPSSPNKHTQGPFNPESYNL
eukprot:scaffold9087_cov119-Isochrysis_galbana.AAC.2